jgi:alcohol dehydrogenase class IV
VRFLERREALVGHGGGECEGHADIGLPRSLRDVEIEAGLIPAMAESAYHNDLNHTTNPWPVTLEDLTKIYYQALD